MRIKINPDYCPNRPPSPPQCMRCLKRYFEYPEGYELRCFESVEGAHEDEFVIVINSAGGSTIEVNLDAQQRLYFLRGAKDITC